VIIHNTEADSPKMMPVVSTLNARDIPGDMDMRDISGYLPSSTAGSIENIIPNIATELIIVQNSRTLGQREDIKISTVPSTGTSTAARG